MFKSPILAAFIGASLMLAGCAGVNETAKKVGVETEFVNVYEGANGFAENAYVTIRLYEATIDAAIYACDVTVNPAAVNTPDVVCIEASKAADKTTPAVKAATRSIGTYLYLDGKVNEILADGKVVPDEVLDAASQAFFKARTEWLDVEQEINVYLGK